MKLIENKCFDEERALYHLENAKVIRCTFAGPADGESALKESSDIIISECTFSLRYPLWHSKNFLLQHCHMDELTRAALWYSENGKITDCTLNGIKCLRECKNISLERITANSPEFGWKCREISMTDCNIESVYYMLECEDSTLKNFTLSGKYSFQYTKNLTVEDSKLYTKDAFWHAKNVTVKNSIVRGEYLGWYSDGLTFINCKISGTQPLCYCKNLRLINCTMDDADLSFEYSDVTADINGKILSVKNPRSGEIDADEIGEIILENSVMENNCRINIKNTSLI